MVTNTPREKVMINVMEKLIAVAAEVGKVIDALEVSKVIDALEVGKVILMDHQCTPTPSLDWSVTHSTLPLWWPSLCWL